MSQQSAHLRGLRLSFVGPLVVAGLSSGHSAGPSRNCVADRPQDFCGWLRAAVRSVQHHSLPLGGDLLAQAAGGVAFDRQAILNGKRHD